MPQHQHMPFDGISTHHQAVKSAATDVSLEVDASNPIQPAQALRGGSWLLPIHS